MSGPIDLVLCKGQLKKWIRTKKVAIDVGVLLLTIFSRMLKSKSLLKTSTLSMNTCVFVAITERMTLQVFVKMLILEKHNKLMKFRGT